MDARKSENNFSPQTPYILIVIKSNGGSGGSTPDFQAGGSGFDSWDQWKFSKSFNRGSGGSENPP